MKQMAVRAAAATAVIGIFTSISASADPIADFYKGKRLQVIVGSGPGGGYDTYARLLTRHMGRSIPGNPDFIVKNQEGAGSIVAMNFIYNVAPQDGTVIVAPQRAAPMVEILGQQGPKFESEKFHWLGSLNNEAGVLAIAKRAGVPTMQQAFTKKANFGSTGPNDTEVFPALMNNTLGTKFQIIRGYRQTPPIHLAIERGELDGISQSWSSFKIHGGGLNAVKANFDFLVQLSSVKHPQLTEMGVPMIFDFITEERLLPGFKVEEVKTYFRLMLSTKAMGRPFALGPKVPTDRVKALRTAFLKTAEDPKFVAEAEKQKRDIVVVSGDELQEIVVNLKASPKEIIARLDDLSQYKGAVKTVKAELLKHAGKVTRVDKGGRIITIDAEGKSISTGISGSRTKVTIGGKADKRDKIKVGMSCTIALSMEGAKEATEVACKN